MLLCADRLAKDYA